MIRTTGSTRREAKWYFELLREGEDVEEVPPFSTGRIRDKNRVWI
jgi:hypothetical protein